jgi:CheY-like chemotaxis protein
LALAKRLTEMHEGTIGVSSTLGQGSEFVVSLPVHRRGTALPMPPVDSSEPAHPIEPSLRILIVDDNADAATALEMLLQESGHQTWVAHTGPDGLASAVAHRPAVILLDIGLPGFDGYEVAQQVRREPLLQKTVLVAMTGYGHETDRQRSRAAGFDHHLVKPVDFGKVRPILASVGTGAT